MDNNEISIQDLDLLSTAFKLYNISKSHSNIYKKGDNSLCKSLILQYYRIIKPNHTKMVSTFKRKYVSNEALVEKNDTPEERQGLSLVYDYIQNFDINKDSFNIFINSMIIHSILYKPLDDKIGKEYEDNYNEAKRLLVEAKKEHSIEKYKKATLMLKLEEKTRFGGALRTDAVIMRDFKVDIPDSSEVIKIMNSYLTEEKKNEYLKALNDPDILHYIEYAVKTTGYLIGIQPFKDGNKRTFRSLLNLMFKNRNLPPVYIIKKERKAYHDALEKGIVNNDYDDLVTFYYYKICDSIYELDFKPRIEEKKKESLDSQAIRLN